MPLRRPTIASDADSSPDLDITAGPLAAFSSAI